MRTEKLYEDDSHLRQFTAKVLSCEEGPSGWEVRLDRTAFYPEGGGQPWDLGMLGGVQVTKVLERDGEVFHILDQQLEAGAEVPGEIDWPRRLDLMQQHSGEHILSGLVHQNFGYDNVGFHMGRETITVDFNGELEEQQLREIERKANEVVWHDLHVRILYPDKAALAALPYRSKKKLTGRVRVVEYPGVDLCACCGTHVARTGEIGLILLLSCVKFRGGVRIEMLSGGRALAYTEEVLAQNRKISNVLSAKPLETASAVQRTQDALTQVKYRLMQTEEQLFARKAEALRGSGQAVLFEENLDPDGVRRLAIAVSQQCSGLAAVFSGDEERGYHYALYGEQGDLRLLSREMNAALDGQGGGKPTFVQGSVRAARAQIEDFFQKQEKADD